MRTSGIAQAEVTGLLHNSNQLEGAIRANPCKVLTEIVVRDLQVIPTPLRSVGLKVLEIEELGTAFSTSLIVS